MTTRVITPSAELAVTVAEARTSARLNGTALDAELTRHIRAATAEVEHKTGRALLEQGFELILDAFAPIIELTRSPAVEVQSIKYFDIDGAEQTLAPNTYIVDVKSEPAMIRPPLGACWPSTAVRPGAVTVAFTAGYGETEAAVPDQAKDFILARVAAHYAPPGAPANNDLCGLLSQLKVY